jgi:UDP-N-acetylmuramate: L-alanyl-gamma-D-glutamyl-meso-diaminopimelate ligase
VPVSYFSVEGSACLEKVPSGGRIHVIGVCGVAMAQLAVVLAREGYRVSGSDKEFYDPMGSLLRSSKIELFQGYDGGHVGADVDLAIIGNAMFRDNPEVQILEKRGVPYSSFPQIVGESVIGDRHSIVVTGTHGKTTTTGLIASVLVKAGLDPSYFIGGMSEDLPDSLHIGQGKFSVVEGDEYHSAFYARVPKFNFYRARTCILNAIEFDHADIYPELADVVAAFRALLLGLPAGGRAICCTDFPHVRTLLQEVGPELACEIVTFGTREGVDYRLGAREQGRTEQVVHLESRRLGELDLTVPLMGEYNALNAIAGLASLVENGLEVDLVREHLRTARTVKRRQQVRFEGRGVTLIEDFAHHPTAVSVTVRAVREVYPDRKLWAVFEPRSNTSRRKVFQEEYEKAFEHADQVILADVGVESRMNQNVELIDVAELATILCRRGKPTRALPGATAIQETLLRELGGNDVVLLMSNGSFGGLPANLERALREKIESRDPA